MKTEIGILIFIFNLTFSLHSRQNRHNRHKRFLICFNFPSCCDIRGEDKCSIGCPKCPDFHQEYFEFKNGITPIKTTKAPKILGGGLPALAGLANRGVSGIGTPGGLATLTGLGKGSINGGGLASVLSALRGDGGSNGMNIPQQLLNQISMKKNPSLLLGNAGGPQLSPNEMNNLKQLLQMMNKNPNFLNILQNLGNLQAAPPLNINNPGIIQSLIAASQSTMPSAPIGDRGSTNLIANLLKNPEIIKFITDNPNIIKSFIMGLSPEGEGGNLGFLGSLSQFGDQNITDQELDVSGFDYSDYDFEYDDDFDNETNNESERNGKKFQNSLNNSTASKNTNKNASNNDESSMGNDIKIKIQEDENENKTSMMEIIEDIDQLSSPNLYQTSNDDVFEKNQYSNYPGNFYDFKEDDQTYYLHYNHKSQILNNNQSDSAQSKDKKPILKYGYKLIPFNNILKNKESDEVTVKSSNPKSKDDLNSTSSIMSHLNDSDSPDYEYGSYHDYHDESKIINNNEDNNDYDGDNNRRSEEVLYFFPYEEY